MGEQVEVDIELFKSLLEDSRILQYLMEQGVEQWYGYDQAVDARAADDKRIEESF